MSKFYEVVVKIHSRVLVEVEDYESENDALTYATAEYFGVDGDITASVHKQLTSNEDVEASKFNSDTVLPINN